MPSTAISTPNIALIKYWGNRHEAYRLPVADSLSMALDTPSVEITVDHAEQFSLKSYDMDGNEKVQSETSLKRYDAVMASYQRYLGEMGLGNAIPKSLSVVIKSAIPPSIGIASSAAVFSCLAEATAGLIKDKRELDRRQISVLARLGSGSACRGAYDGYVAIRAGEGDDIDAAYAEQIADDAHWLLHDVILVPSTAEKKVGSTEGHAGAATSPHFAERVRQMPRRMKECSKAIRDRDFEKLQYVSEEDALDMHHCMQTQNPPLQYLNAETLRIVEEIKALRKRKHLPALFTMDAGPTVHLFCTDDALQDVLEYAEAQKNCLLFRSKTGKGSFLKN